MIKLITFLVFTIGLNFFPTFVYAADPNANNPLSNIINIGATPPVQSSTNPSLEGAPTATIPAPTATIPAPTATIPAPTASGSTPQSNDYANNIKSNVFGANLFTGSFAMDGATQFNPNYLIAVGDNIQVTLWGAYSYSAVLTVDPKGNIFIPNLGPFRVMGIRNSQLQKFFELTVAKTFKSNVNAYISLAMAQPVKVFVSGFVNRPGLYSGTSMDNLLHFIDEAGGIDPERGSFINIKIIRGQQIRGVVNLYEFLISGTMPTVQLNDGDVILIEPRQKVIQVLGYADNAKRFEFSNDLEHLTLTELIRLAKPQAKATHVRVTRNAGMITNTEYYPLLESDKVALNTGDTVEFTADKKPGTISVRVQGEHLSAQEYVLPYGSKMGEILKLIKYSERSDKDNIQLFRTSVHDRQKTMLMASLQSLQTAALTAKSGSSDEASLRKDEATMILTWIDRAKNIEPTGQVVIAQSNNKEDLLLENGDILNVPTKEGLVLVAGEVLFPNATAFNSKLSIQDYISNAGGYSQNADVTKLIIARADGSFSEIDNSSFFNGGNLFSSSDSKIKPGDHILVMPKIDVKSRQFFKEMTQIMYQLAVSAKIVLGI